MSLQLRNWATLVTICFAISLQAVIAHGQIRLPAIDPSGNRIFLPAPNSTTLLTPNSATQNALGNPLRPGIFGQGAIFGRNQGRNQLTTQPPVQTQTPQPTFLAPAQPRPPSFVRPNQGPAFRHPQTPPPCGTGFSDGRGQRKKHFIPDPRSRKTSGQRGQILMTPSRIIAPVGSEVVVIAGICGGDGFLALNQPLEWILSNDSVGQIIEVGGLHHSGFNNTVPPKAKKFDGQYAWGRTGLKRTVLTRGTPTPCDDIELARGQTFISVSSASPGRTYVTGVAPKAEGWDRRRATTMIQWVDALWSTPVPSRATAGTVFPLTTVVNRSSDGSGVKDWKIKYTIVGGAAAEFAPAGSSTATATTNEKGEATAQIRQPAGRFEPGATQVRVDITRPALFGEPELLVESGLTTVTWSAPALTIRAIGEKAAELDKPFNYRIEVTNPGDQISRGVVVRTKDIDDSIEYISSTPKPVEFGRQLEWQLGDIAPGSQPRVIDIQFKSNKRGNNGLCFEVASDSDRLRTEACAQIEIAVPCLVLNVDGPETAIVGNDVIFNFKVSNQCDEELEDIDLVLRYDAGLYADGRSNPIQTQFDKLSFGEERTVSVAFNVQQPGTRCFELSVTSASGYNVTRRECLEASASRTPELQLRLEGQSPIEVGQSAQVNAYIINSGNTAVNSIILTNKFSDSLEAVRATEDFPFTRISDTEYTFAIGRVEPGEERLLEVQYVGKRPDGNASSEFALTSTSNVNQTQRFDIRIEPNPNDPNGGNGSPFVDPGTGGSGRVNPDGSPNFTDRPGAQSPPVDPTAPNPNPPNNPSVRPDASGAVGIPDDRSLLASEALEIAVETQTPTIKLPNSNENLPTVGEIQFSVTNRGNEVLNDVLVSFLIPPGVVLRDYRSIDNSQIIERNDNQRIFDLSARQSMRPGDRMTFSIFVEGERPGRALVEVGANAAGLEGGALGSDVIDIAQ